MAHFETARPAPFGAITAFRLVTLLGDGLSTVFDWYSSRKTAQDLHGLSDEMLRDIGLYRGQIEDVANRLSMRR